MATTEERVSVVEETQRILAEVNSRQQRFIEQNALRIDAHEERMEELRRYTIQAHRIWVWLAKTQGWPDEEPEMG